MEGCGVRPAAGTVGLRRRESRRNPANPSEALAKTMRTPCEDQANNTLSIPDPSPVPTLSAGRGVPDTAGAGAVRHSRKEEADAKVPACLSNSALHRLPGTDFPDEPIVLPRALPAS